MARLRDEFLAVASHELNTPLASLTITIQGLLRYIERVHPAPSTDERIPRELNRAAQQVGKLSRLVGNWLHASRFWASRIELHRESLDLAEVVREAAASCATKAARAGSTLRLSLPSHPIIGHWDRIGLDQIVTNLLTNAIKYGRGLPIDVVVEPNRHHASLVVRDRGVGIPRANHQLIFRRLERCGYESEDPAGFGLGLWIVATLVEAMDGNIELESQPGEGSLFRIKLPLVAFTSLTELPARDLHRTLGYD